MRMSRLSIGAGSCYLPAAMGRIIINGSGYFDTAHETRIHACENLDSPCSRHESLEAQVSSMGDAENAALLGEVKALYRDISKKRKSGS